MVGAKTDEGLEPSKTPVGGISSSFSSSSSPPKLTSSFVVVVVVVVVDVFETETETEMDGVVRDVEGRLEEASLMPINLSGMFSLLDLSRRVGGVVDI